MQSGPGGPGLQGADVRGSRGPTLKPEAFLLVDWAKILLPPQPRIFFQGLGRAGDWSMWGGVGGLEVGGGSGLEFRQQSLRGMGDGMLKAHTLSKGSYLRGREGEPAQAGSCDQGN